jgi:hypothetical protein
MDPFRAGYRKPSRRQHLILVLSALAGVIVSGIYFWAAMPGTDVPPVPARGVAHQPAPPRPEEGTFLMVCCVLFFAAIYATGMALYRYFGDAQGYLVVSANAGQHMPLLLLAAGGCLVGLHGTNVIGGSSRVVDWLMLAIGLALLALSAWGLYRAMVVHRRFYRWFYGLEPGRRPEKP